MFQEMVGDNTLITEKGMEKMSYTNRLKLNIKLILNYSNVFVWSDAQPILNLNSDRLDSLDRTGGENTQNS